MSDPVREVTFQNRLTVAGYAERLHDDGYIPAADELIEAVRCCSEFPECSHVLAWYEALPNTEPTS